MTGTTSNTKRLALSSLAAAVALSTSGCLSDSRIRDANKLGRLSQEAGEQLNMLAEDIYDSCLRSARYYGLEIAYDKVSGTYSRPRYKLLEICETESKPAAAKAKAAIQLLTAYLESITNASSDQRGLVSDNEDKLARAIKELSIPTPSETAETPPARISDSGAKNAAKIIELIRRLTTTRRQTKELARAIVCTDEAFTEYTTALERILREGYINGVLKHESKSAEEYYNRGDENQRRSKAPWRDVLELSKESYDAVIPIIRRKDSALIQIAIIERTRKAHHDLANAFRKNDRNKGLSPAECLGNTISDNPNPNSRGASNETQTIQPLSSADLLRAQQITTSYSHDLSYLINRLEQVP
jgi:hypothetical protein